jgi:Peptidase A4 family/Putative Ig domain
LDSIEKGYESGHIRIPRKQRELSGRWSKATSPRSTDSSKLLKEADMQAIRGAFLFALISLLFGYMAAAQEARVAAQFTIRVVASEEVKQLTQLETMKGMRTITLGQEENGRTFEIPVKTYVLVRYAEAFGVQGYLVDPLHGVLESPAGLMHMPMGVMGVLRAVKLGTATITVKAFSKRNLTPRANVRGSTDPSWSGYALKGGPFSFIQGQWRVPTVQEQGGDTYSSAWIGIDGANSNTVLQVGTAHDYSCCLFPPKYYAWYELFPADPVSIPNSVSPGDLMLAIIMPRAGPTATVTPGLPETWTISLNDVTKGWVFTTDVSYTGMLSSAEWIVEAPGVCNADKTSCTSLPLANYGSVDFDIQDFVCPPSGAATCPPNAMGSPNFRVSQSITMAQDFFNFPIFSVPSNPDGDGDGFTVWYAPLSASIPSPPGPLILTTALPNAVLNQPYTQALQLIQDSAPQWQLVGGSLPAGLSFASGIVSGTPTAAGAFVFTVNVTDTTDLGASAQQQITLNVLATPPAGDFSLSASPGIIQQRQGCTGSTTITITRMNGFTGAVQLTSSSLVATFSQNPASSSSALTLSAPCDEWPRSMQVTGTSGSLSHALNIGINAPHCGGQGEPRCP